MNSTPKQRCKYWENCYRKNNEHLEQYLHPRDIEDDKISSKAGSANGSSSRKSQLLNSEKSSRKVSDSAPDRNSSFDIKPSPGKLQTPNSLSATSSCKTDLASTTLLHSSCSTPTSTKRSFNSEVREDRSTHSGNRKRRKLTETIKHDRYYFTKVTGHPDKFSDDIALSFRDILSLDGKITKSWQFTYMVDLDWLLEEYPDNAAEGPIFLFLGEKQAKEIQDQIMLQKTTTSQPRKYSLIIVVPVSLPLSYGTHHTKLMLLQSEAGVRVVIHTANLLQVDWTVKTQGVWVSPLCPLLSEGKQETGTGKQEDNDQDQDCLKFKSYLLKYLSAYNLPATDQLTRILSKYDMSRVTQVKLVGSVPGLHTTSLYGYLRLEKLLSLSVDDTRVRPGWRVVVNCSSIGTLGGSSTEWFDKFTRVLQTTNSGVEEGRSSSHPQPPPPRRALCQLVFPTVDMIRNSLEGYCGGGSVPYSLRTHRRQPWLRDHMCQWDSKEHGRSRVVPHIKSYTRLSPDMRSIAWFLLTSANLSKAAWGQELQDGRFRVRSYELGVLFVSEDPGKVYNKQDGSGMLVPYSLPPRPYSKTDKPWIADIAYSQLDTHGNKWPIDSDNDLLEME